MRSYTERNPAEKNSPAAGSAAKNTVQSNALAARSLANIAQLATAGSQAKQLVAAEQMADNSQQVSQAFSLQSAESHTIEHYGGELRAAEPSAENPIQRVMRYGDTHSLEGVNGTVHWHYSFNDTDVNSMHLTIADTQNYGHRTWASRKSYAPTDRNGGNWSGWVNNHGNTPGWATDLAGNSGHAAAEAAYHANATMVAALAVAFPQAAAQINNLADFPPLVPPAPAQQAPPAQQGFVFNVNAPEFVPGGGV